MFSATLLLSNGQHVLRHIGMDIDADIRASVHLPGYGYCLFQGSKDFTSHELYFMMGNVHVMTCTT